jgi:hypothetical protein
MKKDYLNLVETVNLKEGIIGDGIKAVGKFLKKGDYIDSLSKALKELPIFNTKQLDKSKMKRMVAISSILVAIGKEVKDNVGDSGFELDAKTMKKYNLNDDSLEFYIKNEDDFFMDLADNGSGFFKSVSKVNDGLYKVSLRSV